MKGLKQPMFIVEMYYWFNQRRDGTGDKTVHELSVTKETDKCLYDEYGTRHLKKDLGEIKLVTTNNKAWLYIKDISNDNNIEDTKKMLSERLANWFEHNKNAILE